MGFSDSFFARKFGISEHDLQSYISEALSSGGDYADLYFEYVSTTSISIDEVDRQERDAGCHDGCRRAGDIR